MGQPKTINVEVRDTEGRLYGLLPVLTDAAEKRKIIALPVWPKGLSVAAYVWVEPMLETVALDWKRFKVDTGHKIMGLPVLVEHLCLCSKPSQVQKIQSRLYRRIVREIDSTLIVRSERVG